MNTLGSPKSLFLVYFYIGLRECHVDLLSSICWRRMWFGRRNRKGGAVCVPHWVVAKGLLELQRAYLLARVYFNLAAWGKGAYCVVLAARPECRPFQAVVELLQLAPIR